MVSKLKNVKIPEEMLEQLTQESQRLRISQSAIIRMSVSKYLEDSNK